MVETWALEFSRKPILVTLCAKNKQIEELRRWSMRQNELMKKEKKHSMIERSSFQWRNQDFSSSGQTSLVSKKIDGQNGR